MTAGVVVFDPAAFVARYPQFAAFNTANPGLLQDYFDDAAANFLNNTVTSRVCCVDTRQRLLWLLVAHLATLGGALSADGTSGPVGRLSSATEGSVTASFDMAGASANSAFWLQTPYGAQYWQATLRFRQFRYIAPRRCC